MKSAPVGLGGVPTTETTENTEMSGEETACRLHGLTEAIIGAAIEVHRELGRGLQVERQKSQPVTYKAVRIDCGHRVDLSCKIRS